DARGARRSETVAEGPALSGGTTDAARFAPTADEDPLTLLDRLREMVGDLIGPGGGGASSAGEDSGTGRRDRARRRRAADRVHAGATPPHTVSPLYQEP